MKAIFLLFPFLFAQQQPVPKNNPNGIWKQSYTDSQWEIRQNGSELQVKMVPGSNPKYPQYEVNMKNEQEVNTYSGTGFFVAKMNSGKECRFTTEWRFVVVTVDRIIGAASTVTADQATCEIQERTQIQLDLKRQK